MKTFDTELAKAIFEGFRDVPEGQMSCRLREESLALYDRQPPPTILELWNHLNGIARNSCCETSSFVKVLCDVAQFYGRPDDDMVTT